MDRSGNRDPQVVVPGSPAPGGSRVISPDEARMAEQMAKNPVLSALGSMEVKVEGLKGYAQDLARQLAMTRITISAMRAAIVNNLVTEDNREKFIRDMILFEKEHGEVHNLLLRMTQEEMDIHQRITVVKEFNEEHTTQIRGDQFGLVEYLEENPDNLSEEERDELAAQFNLFRMTNTEEGEKEDE